LSVDMHLALSGHSDHCARIGPLTWSLRALEVQHTLL